MKKKAVESFVRRMDHAVWKVVDGKGILLNLEDGAYFEVDPVGLSIWNLCNGNYNTEKIINLMSKKFPGNVKQLTKDTPYFLNELKRRNLIETVSVPTPAVVQP